MKAKLIFPRRWVGWENPFADCLSTTHPPHLLANLFVFSRVLHLLSPAARPHRALCGKAGGMLNQHIYSLPGLLAVICLNTFLVAHIFVGTKITSQFCIIYLKTHNKINSGFQLILGINSDLEKLNSTYCKNQQLSVSGKNMYSVWHHFFQVKSSFNIGLSKVCDHYESSLKCSILKGFIHFFLISVIIEKWRRKV